MGALGGGFLLSFSALGSKFFDSCLRYDARGFWKAKQRTTHKAAVPVRSFFIMIEIYDREQRGHPLKSDKLKQVDCPSRRWSRSLTLRLNSVFPATPSPGIAALPSSSASPRRSAPEQGPGPDCARRLSAGKPAPLRRARGSAPRFGPTPDTSGLTPVVYGIHYAYARSDDRGLSRLDQLPR